MRPGARILSLLCALLACAPALAAAPADPAPRVLYYQGLYEEIARGDLEAAIAEGATIVRVGTALFGPRRPA